MTKDEALKLALEAMMKWSWPLNSQESEAIAAIRQALEQPEQEPVAYITGEYKGYFTIEQTNKSFVLTQGMNLYTAPPKRKWVGLTDEELRDILLS